VHFLSLDAKIMKNKMHPGLLRHLLQNNINVGADLNDLGVNHESILGALTDIHRTKAEAAMLMGGSYCLTGDSLMKMLAIYVRVRCGIPVILMGEAGIGKTHILSYLCMVSLGAVFMCDHK
jgi:midasin (ATPase involved in ribosome maturation)